MEYTERQKRIIEHKQIIKKMEKRLDTLVEFNKENFYLGEVTKYRNNCLRIKNINEELHRRKKQVEYFENQ